METGKTLSHLEAVAAKSGFELYSDFRNREYPTRRTATLTCTKGKYSGEVLDIQYMDSTGIVMDVVYSTQFKGQEPKFKF